ncbi:MAG: hypothetical protein ABIF09_14125, partial [Gemmatimonadota bacterium]
DTPVRGLPGSRTADVDRTSLWEDTILEYLKGKDIVAVEFYRSIGEVPPELKDYAYLDWDLSGRGWVSPVSNCGLVIFWTRAGCRPDGRGAPHHRVVASEPAGA